MNTNEIINGHEVQHDRSGVGHCWQSVGPEEMSADVCEEIACWIIEDDPGAGEEITGSNGRHYRLPPTDTAT